jgi:hypothetical protein
MGMMDRAFMDAGFAVVPGCEIDPEMREMYSDLCGDWHRAHDLRKMLPELAGEQFDGIIGGPPCQAHSRLRAMRDPKFPDLTPEVQALLDRVPHRFFLFENVVPLELEGASVVRLNAMHFAEPHQSRERWFTHSPELKPPTPSYRGTVDDLLAYPAVAGRIYGPKRGARLHGYPAAAELPFPCAQLQKGLANAVPYPLALAWATTIREQICPMKLTWLASKPTFSWPMRSDVHASPQPCLN